jgi:hypothetical protein
MSRSRAGWPITAYESMAALRHLVEQDQVR